MHHCPSWLMPVVAVLLLGGAGPALAGNPMRDLAAADRLACAFLKGITASFTAQGGVLMKPPLDPNTPGLTIAIVDRSKGQAVLEEDTQETPGILKYGPDGLSILARDPAGNTTLVTVFPLYVGVSDNFIMVSSRHGVGVQPQMSQRYGLCRAASATSSVPSAPTPAASPAAHK